MPFNIEFQIAGLIFVSIIIVVFFSKPRWKSVQNSVFRVLMFATWIELFFDIVSVITISKRDVIPSWVNDFFSKGYIVAMLFWIATAMTYIVANTYYEGMSETEHKLKKILLGTIFVSLLVCVVFVLIYPILYGGSGRYVYSYGIPSTITYIFSVACVIIAITLFIINFKKISFDRKVPTLCFTIMEGSVALIQMQFKELLLLGIGTAICIFLMYMTMENPDMDMIAKLNAANKRSEELLLNIFPASIVSSLRVVSKPITRSYEDVSVGFIDIVDFTKMSAKIGAEKLVNLLNQLFSEIDMLVDKYKIEKIKTIGDAYMVASGLPDVYEDHSEQLMLFMLDVLRYMKYFNLRNNTDIKIRIGMNCGPAVAGVIGKKKYIYDMWGETVNFASRMESTGIPGRIQVSESIYQKLKDSYNFECREHIEVKGVGDCRSYLLCG